MPRITPKYLANFAKTQETALARIKEVLEDAGVPIVIGDGVGDNDMLLTWDDDGRVIARINQ